MNMEGSLVNRLMEGKKFEDIKVGTDITMYHYTDRTCYYVTEVINDKHIFVKQYEICADHSKEPMSNEWMYFKSKKEMNAYLNSCKLTDSEGNLYKYIEDPVEPEEEEWVFRYGNWHIKCYDFNGKPIYRKLNKVSFGVKDYYYDYEF